MRWKRKKEVTSETAYCFSLKKRKYIFCRKSFFTTKHKILKRQKKGKKGNIWSGQLWRNIWSEKRQPVLLKCMRRKKKKEVASETASCFSLKKRKYIFCRKSFLPQNTKYLKKARKAKSGKKEKKKLSKTLIVLVCVHWWVSDAFPLTFLLKLSTDVCSLLFHRCLLLTSCNWPRLQTNLQHVKNWSRDRNRSHREKQTEIEIEIEARNWNWNRNRSWLKTEIEIETEIDYWNRDRLLKTSPEWKSTSEPKRLFEVDFESGFTDLCSKGLTLALTQSLTQP